MGQPDIFGDTAIDKTDGLPAADLYSRLSLFSSTEPGFRPTPHTFIVKEDTDNPRNIIVIYLNLKVCQRVYN